MSDGNSGNNYAVTFANNTTGVITAKTLTVTGITANNKTYDTTTAATLNTGSAALVGVVTGDNITLNTGAATGTFASTNVGTGITVTVSGLTITGTDAGNYSLTEPTTTANITQATPTVMVAGGPFTYNGNAQTATATATGGRRRDRRRNLFQLPRLHAAGQLDGANQCRDRLRERQLHQHQLELQQCNRHGLDHHQQGDAGIQPCPDLSCFHPLWDRDGQPAAELTNGLWLWQE